MENSENKTYNYADYRVRDSLAAFRDKMRDILYFIINGHKCCESAAKHSDSPELKAYHFGKAQAFAEVIEMFERYRSERPFIIAIKSLTDEELQSLHQLTDLEIERRGPGRNKFYDGE